MPERYACALTLCRYYSRRCYEEEEETPSPIDKMVMKRNEKVTSSVTLSL